MERQSDLYYGQTAQTFTILGEFDLSAQRLAFSFETWASVAVFESGADPIRRLRREFILEGDALQTFRTQNQTVFTSIENKALDIALVGGRGYLVQRLFISTIAKFLFIDASSPSGEDRPSAKKYGLDYDQIIADNALLISQMVGVTWAYGKENDEFLNQMTPTPAFAEITQD